MNTDGSIDSTIEINDTTTNGPTLSNFDYYGLSIASVGDLNADGVLDLVVGSPSSTSIGKGKVYIHFMNADGSIDSTVEINSSTENGPSLSNYDLYGFSLTSIGDLNSDGVDDLAVGSPGDDAGGTDRGEIYIHFMNTDGSIDSTIELNGSTANGATLVDGTTYGASIASIGDLDGNGINDLATGIDVDGSFHGALLIHFMHKVTVAVAENKFSEDKRCHYDTPPEITWIKITPDEEGGISGILITWTQYSANKVTIKIDDGTDNFPWELSKTANDGHEFLPNVATWQEIKVKPYNHCRSGEYSVPTSYNLYPYGWYNE